MRNLMKKLPIGIQDVKKILSEDKYVYVDKTGFAYQLINEGFPCYFLSRPRRFGKSLFVNTLEHIFKGNKELFKGCQIYESDYSWQEYPIIHFDFSQILTRSSGNLEDSLKRTLIEIAKDYAVSVDIPSSQEGMVNLVKALSKKNKVVVLVDEYDKPIINNLKNLTVAEQNRDLMGDLFGALKSLDECLKFTFFTGVSKFSQVSIFSGLNHLTDITMEPEYGALMGYTEEELKREFSEHLKDVAKIRNMSEQAILEELRKWYNGYSFSENTPGVYNPFSTLRFFKSKKPQSYWYATGTPSFLIDQVKSRPHSVIPLQGAEALKSELSDINRLDDIDLVPLMFQTGYLTITSHREEENSYTLDFPNKEVKEAFLNTLLKDFAKVNPLIVMREANKLKCAIEAYDLEDFFKTINAHFAKISYQAFLHAKEGFYQAVFFTLLEKSGITTITEMTTNIGRIDLACLLGSAICIFELKLDKNADIALTQAETRKYRERFSSSDKPTLVVGVNFNSELRNISDWKGLLFSPKGEVLQELSPLSKSE